MEHFLFLGWGCLLYSTGLGAVAEGSVRASRGKKEWGIIGAAKVERFFLNVWAEQSEQPKGSLRRVVFCEENICV